MDAKPAATMTQSPRPDAPHRYPKRILLAVTGLSPQIVTETLFALVRRTDPPFMPTEIRLLTTREGRQRASLALLSDDPGWFRRICKDYDLPPIHFDVGCIEVLPDAQEGELDDIRSRDDNRRAADFITERVRELTHDPDTALHVSIAGGRKTMGFFLGYALSLFGREQDRLSHVLVSDPYESTWEFFYPTPYHRVIETRDRKLIDTAEAEVMLADIPFVRLRNGLPQDLLNGRVHFSEAVEALQRRLDPPHLTLDPTSRRVRAAGRVFRLPASAFAFLLVFAKRARDSAEALPAPGKGVPDPEWKQRYLDEYLPLKDQLADHEATERALKDGMEGDFFSQRLSKLHRLLRNHLGVDATPYLIDEGGRRPRRYRLKLPPEAIRISEIGKDSSDGR